MTMEVPAGAVITPLARDTARTLGIKFVRTTPAVVSATATPGIVALGSDHGGFSYKTELAPFIRELDFGLLDVGTDSKARCDYPDFAFAVGRAVSLGKADFGVMIDGTGAASAIVCNKIPGIRAVCACCEYTATTARSHGNAQVLTLGARVVGLDVCKGIVRAFLTTVYEGRRHKRRLDKIADVEARYLRQDSR